MIINNLNFIGPYYYDRNFNQTFACLYAIVIGNKLIYIGITDNINERMENHHKIECWKKYSSDTRVMYIYKEPSQLKRQIIERNIINFYNPPCNDR